MSENDESDEPACANCEYHNRCFEDDKKGGGGIHSFEFTGEKGVGG